MDAPILADVRNHIGHLTLNRPEGLNALNLEMVQTLRRHLDAWEHDVSIQAVVLRANGDKAFCAGGDIRSLYENFNSGSDEYLAFFEQEYALDQRIHSYAKPVVALMNGFVLGGGMGLVQGAALRVISDRVKMGMPETGIGYFPDVGGSYFLSRLPGHLGEYIGITGVQLRAADSLYAQLADFCMPHESFSELDQALDNLRWSDHPLNDIQEAVGRLSSSKLVGAELRTLQPAIDKHFGQPDMASIQASLAQEENVAYQDWAEKTLALLESRSPLAMATTLEMLRRGRSLSLVDCFEMELHLDRQWFANGDIMEGVRALIIDKDKAPKWNPPSVAELEPGRVTTFFQGLGRTVAAPSQH